MAEGGRDQIGMVAAINSEQWPRSDRNTWPPCAGIRTFIHAYTLVNGRPPAQTDIQRFFQVTPPSVHQMLLTLERSGLISRRPGAPRSIAVLVDRSDLPALEPGYGQPVKITVTRY